MSELKNYWSALARAQALVKGVEKHSTNSYMKYKYASTESIIEEAKVALSQCDMAVIADRWSLHPPRGEGEPGRVEIHFVSAHGPSGESREHRVEYFVIPEKGRPLDKATASALTMAEGYFLRGFLCMPRVDETLEVDQRDDRNYEPPPRVSPRPAPRPPEESFATGKDPSELVTDAEVVAMRKLLATLGKSDGDLIAWANQKPGREAALTDLSDFTQDDYQKAMVAMSKKVSHGKAG